MTELKEALGLHSVVDWIALAAILVILSFVIAQVSKAAALILAVIFAGLFALLYGSHALIAIVALGGFAGMYGVVKVMSTNSAVNITHYHWGDGDSNINVTRERR